VSGKPTSRIIRVESVLTSTQAAADLFGAAMDGKYHCRFRHSNGSVSGLTCSLPMLTSLDHLVEVGTVFSL
jgi:hypothetical protein